MIYIYIECDFQKCEDFAKNAKIVRKCEYIFESAMIAAASIYPSIAFKPISKDTLRQNSRAPCNLSSCSSFQSFASAATFWPNTCAGVAIWSKTTRVGLKPGSALKPNCDTNHTSCGACPFAGSIHHVCSNIQKHVHAHSPFKIACEHQQVFAITSKSTFKHCMPTSASLC